MKKRILTLCGVGIASIALASCGGNKEITYEEESVVVPTEKGNKIDNLDKTYYPNKYSSFDLSINSNMSFLEVFKELGGLSYQINGTNNNIKYKNITKSVNKYEAINTFTFENSLGFIFKDKESTDNVNYSCTDLYYEKNTDYGNIKVNNYYSYLNYIKTKSSDDFETSNTLTKYSGQNAGYFESTKENNVTIEKIKNASKTSNEINDEHKKSFSNDNINSNSNKKYYIEATEKSTDSNYDKEYVGRSNKIGNIFYSISEEYIGNSASSTYVSINSMFSFKLSSLYETSYELTDKYIILKSKCNFTDEIYNMASNEDEINKLIQNDYKGSSSEYEIWILHTGNDLVFDYYKESINTVYNIDKIYEESDFASFSSYSYTYGYEDYIGKKTVKKGNTLTYKEISTLDNTYNKKMNDLYAECEKDNAYKDVVFKPYNPSLF